MARLPLLATVTILLGISLLVNIQLLTARAKEDTVSSVVDGDTFQLTSGKRVRLMGVDSPESQSCGGSEAKQRLSELVLNKAVLLKEGVSEAYGRTLALVYVDDQLINKIIMEEGWGRPDYRKNSQREVLTRAYKQAVKNKLGLWGQCISRDALQSQCQIKGNIDTATYEKFYHLPSCTHYKETVLNLAFGEAWFCSEKDARDAGFKKAQSCP